GSGLREVVWRGLFASYSSSVPLPWVQFKSENCNLATIERGTRSRLVLLQTLRTRDFDDLAEAFPRWDLRFRQLGRGPFRGRLQFLQWGGLQVFQVAVNRRVHVEGWPPPGSFGYAPVLAANAGAVWRGPPLNAGPVP